LIFVAGLPRSGTTLVQNVLDCHPEITGGPEFDRIPNIVDLRRKLLSSVYAGRIDYYLTGEAVDDAIGSLIETLLLATADRRGKRLLSEKTPWNILAFPDLMDVLPSARFIHVLRDPRAVVNSMRKVAEKGKEKGVRPPDFTTNLNLALYYAEAAYRIADICTSKAAPRFLTVKFEELVTNTERETRRICDFLNVAWDKAMLFPANTPHPGEAQMTQNSIWYDKKMYARNPDSSGLDAWRHELGKVHVAFINEVLRKNPYFSRFGYDLSDADASVSDKNAAIGLYTTYKASFNFDQMPLRVLA